MRVAIIDQQSLIRRGVAAELLVQFENVEMKEAEGFDLFRELYPDFIPDIVILGLDSVITSQQLDLIGDVCFVYPQAQLIVLDETLSRSAVSAYFKAGASGCLSKYSSVDQLKDCLRLVTTGKRYLSSEILIWLLRSEFGPRQSLGHIVGNLPRLTARQREMAYYFASGMPSKVIAVTKNVRQSTVSTIKSTIFKKLGVTNIIQLKEILPLLEQKHTKLVDSPPEN